MWFGDKGNRIKVLIIIIIIIGSFFNLPLVYFIRGDDFCKKKIPDCSSDTLYDVKTIYNILTDFK